MDKWWIVAWNRHSKSFFAFAYLVKADKWVDALEVVKEATGFEFDYRNGDLEVFSLQQINDIPDIKYVKLLECIE